MARAHHNSEHRPCRHRSGGPVKQTHWELKDTTQHQNNNNKKKKSQKESLEQNSNKQTNIDTLCERKTRRLCVRILQTSN